MAILQGRTPDALPLLADLTYWYSARVEDGSLDSRYEGQDGLIRLHEDLGCVYYYDYSEYSPNGSRVVKSWADGVEEEQQKDGCETVYTLRTRSGELTGRSRHLPQSYSEAIVEYMVKKPEDLKIIREYMASLRFAPDYEGFLQREDYIGERGITIVLLPQSPLAALTVRFAGVETTSYLSVDAPAEFKRTLECIDETWDSVFELACQSPAFLFHFADNLSAENVGGLCGRYLAPYYRKRVAQLHEAGKIAVTHLDGKIRGLLGQIADTGMDGIEALTTAPIGDIALEHLRGEAGNQHVILWGGLPGALFSYPYSRDDILRQVENIHQVFGKTRRFIPGTADQVPPDADIQLVRLAAETLSMV